MAAETLESTVWRQIRSRVTHLADAIRTAAEANPGNEAQFVLECDHLLADVATNLGLCWDPRGERRVVWQEDTGPRSGRIDRLFHRVVVEYEPPGSLYPTNEGHTNRHAIEQARQYMDALIATEGWESPSVAGVVTDGLRFIFCRYSAGQWVQEAPTETNPVSVGRFLRLLLTFRRPPLLPEPLVREFGAESEKTTIATVRALYDALGSPGRFTEAVFNQWKDYFADIAGLNPERLQDKKELMTFARRVLGREAVQPDRLLFALYTYSALLIKLLVVAAVMRFFETDREDRLAGWAALEDEGLRERLREVESGAFFARIVRNFTEGDFFGWYVEEWSPAIARQVKQLLTQLSEYDPDAVEQAPERVRDLLKRLYHGLFPRQVRHDLGEYYTPDWLAERLLAQVDSDLFGDLPAGEERRRLQARRVARDLTTKRFLDPACGSGTFLVLIIRRLRQWARECGVSESQTLLPALLQNVVGFDLNPLAVISARANFLLAIADLLDPEAEPVELPIYLADSIVLPAEGQGDSLYSAPKGVYELPLRGVGKQFVVPDALANRERLGTLARLLRRDVNEEVGADAFLRACEGQFSLPAAEWRRSEPHLRELYDMLLQLHREGRNGLWADLARNMFMPLFVSPADYVVGNPPWVNWESLPQEYRDRSKVLWRKCGLFPELKGIDRHLGKTKVDLSQLLTYVAADLYLKRGGKLGFVITQSVFKTSGAGQGFRRFQIGEGDALRVLTVDDFSALQPFEGATNRTAAFVLSKGQPTAYPITYYAWKKGGRRSVPFTASLQEAQELLQSTTLAAEPVDARDPTSAWITATRPALRALRKVLGQSDYRAYAGAYSGGANAVYWLEVLRQNPDGTVQARNITEGAKREVQAGLYTLEPDLLYPLLRGREVSQWCASTDVSRRFLVTAPPGTLGKAIAVTAMSNQFPRTLRYLERHESILRSRQDGGLKSFMARGGEFYAGVFRAYHFAPHKVVWAEQGHFGCAVVGTERGQPVVPDHKIMLLPFENPDEAHFVCGAANSSPFRLGVAAYTISIQQDPHIFQNIRIPRYQPGNPTHARLAELSQRAHAIAAGESPGVLADVEREIDECAAKVWDLTPQELAAVQEALRNR
ncbi:MAG: SAM-dependent DNA methyltransferase [Armatimonadetes bacterium]|nr:SAM-dependent DNA methyltransferase [Armatimonadota bacterium]